MAPKERIEQLRAELEEHNFNYYVKAMPTISDEAYDFLMKELESLEMQHPEYFSADSPSQKVGGAVNKSFESFTHLNPMLSLGNTYNEEELRAFDERVEKGLGTKDYEYICELKFDGLSISLHYERGKLIRAVTRGDGVSGDVVTDNVKTIRTLKTELDGEFPETFEVRGEIFMHKKAFERLNEERQQEGKQTYANPRNFASGSLKMQDSAEVAKRPLDVFLYQVISPVDYQNHWKSLEMAKSWGLRTSTDAQKCTNIDEVLDFIHHWENARHDLGYEIDGVVIKVNDYYQREELGFTAKNPRWAISYKFKTEAACTQLLSVDYQVGRTGSITPVANLEPVLLLGTTVKRASLHNADEIERLGLREQDYVYVEKGGEIIPKITAINTEKRIMNQAPIQFITHCPECQTELVRKEGEANHYCPNQNNCPPQVIGGIQHYTSRKACDIQSIGDETIRALHEARLIHNIADLYDLTAAQVEKLDRMAEKSALNVVEGIDASKQVPFHRVLFGLGIRYVGATVAKKLVSAFKTIENLAKASIEELEAVDEIGKVIAISVKEYFEKTENKELIHRLKMAGVQLVSTEREPQVLSSNLEGKTIVISGVFSQYSRDELATMIEAHGGKKGSGITGKTHYLLAGDKMGPSKLAKAEKLKIPIISEEAFLEMINHSE
jgi:DNA ligase (NAD+)